MKNNIIKTKSGKIMELVQELPYFSLQNLGGVESNKNSLRILCSRYKKIGKIVSLKKGVYVSERYILNHLSQLEMTFYHEFVANILCQPSYLSLEYVLAENNLLTEMPSNFTSMTTKTTAHFSNQFGSFFYHKIKKELFCGFTIIKKGEFTIYKATKAKALFDFLYLRKNSIASKSAAEELRLNLDNFNTTDKKELEHYIKMTGSKKMMTIFDYLFA